MTSGGPTISGGGTRDIGQGGSNITAQTVHYTINYLNSGEGQDAKKQGLLKRIFCCCRSKTITKAGVTQARIGEVSPTGGGSGGGGGGGGGEAERGSIGGETVLRSEATADDFDVGLQAGLEVGLELGSRSNVCDYEGNGGDQPKSEEFQAPSPVSPSPQETAFVHTLNRKAESSVGGETVLRSEATADDFDVGLQAVLEVGLELGSRSNVCDYEGNGGDQPKSEEFQAPSPVSPSPQETAFVHTLNRGKPRALGIGDSFDEMRASSATSLSDFGTLGRPKERARGLE